MCMQTLQSDGFAYVWIISLAIWQLFGIRSRLNYLYQTLAQGRDPFVMAQTLHCILICFFSQSFKHSKQVQFSHKLNHQLFFFSLWNNCYQFYLKRHCLYHHVETWLFPLICSCKLSFKWGLQPLPVTALLKRSSLVLWKLVLYYDNSVIFISG